MVNSCSLYSIILPLLYLWVYAWLWVRLQKAVSPYFHSEYGSRCQSGSCRWRRGDTGSWRCWWETGEPGFPGNCQSEVRRGIAHRALQGHHSWLLCGTWEQETRLFFFTTWKLGLLTSIKIFKKATGAWMKHIPLSRHLFKKIFTIVQIFLSSNSVCAWNYFALLPTRAY